MFSSKVLSKISHSYHPPSDGIELCHGECKKHKKIFSYEAIGDLLFGTAMKYFINLIVLFYLMIAITTYFIIIKVRFLVAWEILNLISLEVRFVLD